jgi:hypothetical protein
MPAHVSEKVQVKAAVLTGVHAHKTDIYGNKKNLKNAPKAPENPDPTE